MSTYLFKKRGVFTIQFIDREGKKRQRSLHTPNRAEALRLFKEFNQHEINMRKSVTLLEYTKQYLDVMHGQLRPLTLNLHRLGLQYLLTAIGNIPINRIGDKSIDTFKSYLLGRMKPVSVSIFYRSCQSAFSTAKRWKMITENPFFIATKVKVPQSDKPAFTMENLRIVLSACRNPQHRNIFEFSFLTGCRRGEVLMAHWTDFDPHLSIIRIGASSQTQTGRIRSVPLSSRAVEILNQQREFMVSESDLIFHDAKGNALKGPSVYHALKKTCKRVGLGNLSFHSLRHGTASTLANLGSIPLQVVQQLLGHSSIQTTMGYIHSSADAARVAVEYLAQKN